MLRRAANRGQTRDVSVYRLIGAGSIEELIYTRRTFRSQSLVAPAPPNVTDSAEIYKQHQAEIAYTAANPSRMFLGVQDDKHNQGELFGVVSRASDLCHAKAKSCCRKISSALRNLVTGPSVLSNRLISASLGMVTSSGIAVNQLNYFVFYSFELMNFASQTSRKRKRTGDDGDSSDQEVDDKQDDQVRFAILSQPELC